MKNSVKKITAAALCTVLIAGSVGITAFAENKTDSDSTTAPIVETAAEEVIEENGAEKKEEKSESAISKDETVYVLLDAEGKTKKIILRRLLHFLHFQARNNH